MATFLHLFIFISIRCTCAGAIKVPATVEAMLAPFWNVGKWGAVASGWGEMWQSQSKCILAVCSWWRAGGVLMHANALEHADTVSTPSALLGVGGFGDHY